MIPFTMEVVSQYTGESICFAERLSLLGILVERTWFRKHKRMRQEKAAEQEKNLVKRGVGDPNASFQES